MNSIVTVFLLLLIAAALIVLLVPGRVYRGAMRLERTLAGLQTRTVVINDIEYRYSDGVDGQPLLLLHGFSAERDHWNRVARYLRGQFRIIAPDLPGFGSSSQDASLNYSIDSQVDRLEAFVDKLGLSDFHLGGSSMGGAIAAIYASRHPERVLSLWLMAPAGVIGEQPSDMESILVSGQAHPLIPRNRQEFEATLDFIFVSRPFLPAPIRRYLSKDAVIRQPLRQQIFNDLLDNSGKAIRSSINQKVTGLAVPALIVWGDRDRVLHPGGAEVLRNLMQNAKVEMMPEVGHLPMLEAPAKTARRFLTYQQHAK